MHHASKMDAAMELLLPVMCLVCHHATVTKVAMKEMIVVETLQILDALVSS